MVNPADLPLPPFLDPLLDYLEEKVPPPFFGILMNTLSHILAILSALFSLIQTIWDSSPSEWNAQTILPPLIALFTAYLALVSAWRTTSWMLRTGIWFAKWGTIISFLAAAAGWSMGNGGNNDGLGALGGLMGGAGGILGSLLAGQGGNAGRGSDRASRKNKQERPKAWESFESHREWQYNEDEANRQNPDIAQYVEAAMQAAQEHGLWGMAQKLMGSNVESNEDDSGTRKKKRDKRSAASKAR